MLELELPAAAVTQGNCDVVTTRFEVDSAALKLSIKTGIRCGTVVYGQYGKRKRMLLHRV